MSKSIVNRPTPSTWVLSVYSIRAGCSALPPLHGCYLFTVSGQGVPPYPLYMGVICLQYQGRVFRPTPSTWVLSVYSIRAGCSALPPLHGCYLFTVSGQGVPPYPLYMGVICLQYQGRVFRPTPSTWVLSVYSIRAGCSALPPLHGCYLFTVSGQGVPPYPLYMGVICLQYQGRVFRPTPSTQH